MVLDALKLLRMEALRAEIEGGAVNSSDHWLDLPENSQLKLALETASEAEKWITPEQARLRELLSEAKTEAERDAREYQIWYIEKYLTRAAAIAKNRLEYFKTIRTEADIIDEKEKIKASPAHWFEYYAFGYDPRARSPLSIVPFALFPKQKEMVAWLDNLVFYQRNSGLIEKARDEGATETIVRWGLFHWLNTSGFSMLLSTRKEDEVDSKKNQNTLFERVRFQIRLLPSWQYPKGFDVERGMLSTMKLANPENGNTLLGEAPVENMGRGGRVTCAMLDEFAFWSFAGYPQYRSLSQTTDSILMPSSVAGRLNQYADLAFDGITPKFTLDWRDNPFKDKRWYDALPFGYISPKMSKTTIAQEVDRNYDAAQPGKVWKYGEERIFITQSEFLRAFKGLEHRFKDNYGRFTIPHDWRIVRTSDYGQTEGHDWSYLLGGQPRENYPLSDTHFVFVGQNLEPTGLTTEQAVAQWRNFESFYGVRDSHGWTGKVPTSYCSHEQKELRDVLLHQYGETWWAWDTDYTTGIETIQDWWTPIDCDNPNPFRPTLSGRCRLIFVAPDDEYSLAFNERLNEYFVTISKTERGFATLRKQASAYHYAESELGKAAKAMRPVKEFDDIIDALRGYAVNWNRKPIEMSVPERIVAEMPPEIAEKPQMTQNERMGQMIYLQRKFEEAREKQRSADTFGDLDAWEKRLR